MWICVQCRKTGFSQLASLLLQYEKGCRQVRYQVHGFHHLLGQVARVHNNRLNIGEAESIMIMCACEVFLSRVVSRDDDGLDMHLPDV